MKILITGASGLLGAHLTAFLSRRHQVTGTDRHPWWGDRPAHWAAGDLEDPSFMETLLGKAAPDCVIHCAAMTYVDLCKRDPVLAHAANAELTRRLARAVSPHCLFVYISTDGLFNGDKPMVTEEEPPMPRTVYGRSKLQGEREVQSACGRHLIVRTNFYGWSSGRKTTFAEWLYGALESGQRITLFEDFFFTPIYVVDLAERLTVLIEAGRTGLFHVAGAERVSKEAFGRQLAEPARFSLENVQRSTLKQASLAADRPRDMSLSSLRFCRATGMTVPGCKEGILRFLGDRGRPLSARCSGSGELLARPA